MARYANPSKEDGRDVLVERRSIKYYRRDGSGGGYSLWYYKAGAVDKLGKGSVGKGSVLDIDM